MVNTGARIRTCGIVAGVVILLAAAVPTRAQQTDPVAAAQAALARGDAPAALRLARRATRQQPGKVEGWMVLGRIYLVLMTEGFLESRAQNAVRAFTEAAVLNPSQADVYFLRGRAYLEGLRDSTRAGADFEQQLQVDPAHTDALVRLLELAVDMEEWELAGDLAGTALVRFAGDVRIYRPLLRLYLKKKEWGAAALVARHYLAVLSPFNRDRIDDLEPLLTVEEAESYRALSPEERDLYRRRYWARRGGARLDGFSHRFLEHIWRTAEARARFGVGEPRWDIRGELFIRYGPPQYRLTSTSGLSLNMILDGEFQSRWRSRMLELEVPTASFETGDYTTFFDPAFEAPRGANRFEFWIYRSEGLLFRFEEQAMGNGFLLASGSGDLEAALKRKLPVISRLEEDTIPLEPAFTVAQFRAPDGGTLLHSYLSLPAVELTGTSADSLPTATLLSQVILTDTAGRIVAEGERSRDLVAGEATRIQRSLRFVDAVVLAAEAGEYELSAFVAERASGRYGTIGPQPVTVRDFSGSELALSDLVLAAPDTLGSSEWNLRNEGLTYLPQPAGVFDLEKPFVLYFEIYNLARNLDGVSTYELTYEVFPEPGSRILPADISSSIAAVRGIGRGTPAVSASTTCRSTGAHAVHRPELSMAAHSEGLYRLRVRVRDLARGTEVARERLFLVLAASPPPP